MPNELFLRTCAGLSHLISSKAAEQILRAALRVHGHSPENVSEGQMRRALVGPVQRELQKVLPPTGLKRTIKELVRTLDLTSSRSRAVAPESAGGTGGTNGSGQSSQLLSTPTSTPAVAVIDQGPEAKPTPVAAADGGSSKSTPSGNGSDSDEAPPYHHTDEELERFVAPFAQIEQVKLVTAIREDGSLAVVRGSGIELDALSRYSRLALQLLRRGGGLRSLHISHSKGELFLFPFDRDLLVVLGSTELNLGAVTTALSALARQEDL